MKRIVLIDNDQINLNLLWHLLRNIKGYQTANFLDPEEALSWCQDNEPELIIVDYQMPEMNGIDFTENFRHDSEKSNVPVILLTTEDQSDIKHKAVEMGVTDFLHKPVDSTDLMMRVKNLLALKNSMTKISDQNKWLQDEVQKATEEVRNREQEVIFRLTKAAEYRDPETGGHIKRMAHYSRHIAMQLGLPAEQQNLLLEAAPMHDIGKVGIPDSILLKPGKLDSAEYRIMKEHAQYGYDILNDSPSPLMQLGATIALTHHEKYDGSGYPNNLKDEAISIYGRIVAVADVFDALTSERPYKKAWSIDDSVGFLRENSGTHFDRSCVYAFLDDMNEVLRIKKQFKDNE